MTLNCFNKLSISKSANYFCNWSRQSKAWAKTREFIDQEIESIKNLGVYKKERVITSKQSSWINIQEKKDKVLNFCANNYLGLSVSKLT